MIVHPAQRLRVVLFHVEEIVLEVCTDCVGLGEERYTRLRTYKGIIDGLATFGHQGLWSALKRSRLDMKIPRTSGSDRYRNPKSELRTSWSRSKNEPAGQAQTSHRHPVRSYVQYSDHFTVDPVNLPNCRSRLKNLQ